MLWTYGNFFLCFKLKCIWVGVRGGGSKKKNYVFGTGGQADQRLIRLELITVFIALSGQVHIFWLPVWNPSPLQDYPPSIIFVSVPLLHLGGSQRGTVRVKCLNQDCSARVQRSSIFQPALHASCSQDVLAWRSFLLAHAPVN